MTTKIVIINGASFPGAQVGKFYFRSPNGTYHMTSCKYEEVDSIEAFFQLWERLPNFVFNIPSASCWYDENMQECGDITICENDDLFDD